MASGLPGSPGLPHPHEYLELPSRPALLPLYVRACLPRRTVMADHAPPPGLRMSGVRPRGDHVARYAAVVGQSMTDRLPLLYPHVLGFGLQMKIMVSPSFPLPPLGLVHLANEVSVARPIRLGEELDVAVHAGAVRAHRAGRTIDLITTVYAGGAAVWSETSSYLRRGRHAAGSDAAGSDAAGSDAARHDPGLHFSARWALRSDLGRRFAVASGDLNPIHLAALTARPLGFTRAIAHGMWTAAAVAAALEGRLPDALTYRVRFRSPIQLPGTVRLFTGIRGAGLAAEVRGRADDRLHLVAAVDPRPVPERVRPDASAGGEPMVVALGERSRPAGVTWTA